VIELISQYWQSYIYSDGSRFSGLAVTLWLLVATIGISFWISIGLAIVRASRSKFWSRVVWVYTYIFRGTPLYVQLLLCYTGLYSLKIVHHYEWTNEFFRDAMNCTLLAFVLNECAYATEIFAGAIKATSAGEIEAGLAYGMSRFTLYRRVILPSALRRALPS
jgi:histidine transport system permease protein